MRVAKPESAGHVGADQYDHRSPQCSSVAASARTGPIAGGRCITYISVSAGWLRRGYRRGADGTTGGIRAHAELVLRPVVVGGHRVESDMRAALLPCSASAACGR